MRIQNGMLTFQTTDILTYFHGPTVFWNHTKNLILTERPFYTVLHISKVSVIVSCTIYESLFRLFTEWCARSLRHMNIYLSLVRKSLEEKMEFFVTFICATASLLKKNSKLQPQSFLTIFKSRMATYDPSDFLWVRHT